MKKIVLMLFSLLAVSLFLFGCTQEPELTDDEVFAAMEDMSPEEMDAVNAEDGAIAGQAYGFISSSRISKVKSTQVALKSFEYLSCEDRDNGVDLRYARYGVEGTRFLSDRCYTASNKYLDYSCRNDSSNRYSYQYLVCEYGCDSNGCKPKPVKECTDSDEGLRYFVKGTVTGQNEDDSISGVTSATDSCEGDILYEFVCKDTGEYDDESYICPNGCQDGACLPSADNQTG